MAFFFANPMLFNSFTLVLPMLYVSLRLMIRKV